MAGLCLVAGKLFAAIPVAVFTLATTDPVDQSRQEVRWKVVGDRLVEQVAPPASSRDQQSKLALSTELTQGKRVRQLSLTLAPQGLSYELCLEGRCRPVSSLLPGIEPVAVVELKPCPEEP